MSQVLKVNTVIRRDRDLRLPELAVQTKTQAFCDTTTADVELSPKI